MMRYYGTHSLHGDKNSLPAADIVRGVHRLLGMTGKSISKMKKAARPSGSWPSKENSEGKTRFQ